MLRACAGEINVGTLKDVVSIVKEVVENYDRKMTMIILKSKLNKKHQFCRVQKEGTCTTRLVVSKVLR